MIIVITIVDTVAPRPASPRRNLVKSNVEIALAEMFTILFPISIVAKNFSYRSSIFKTACAFLLPSWASVFIRFLLKLVKAVSVPEKNADSSTKITRTAICKPAGSMEKINSLKIYLTNSLYYFITISTELQ